MKEITQEELETTLPTLKGKNVLIIFSATSCTWCQKLKIHLQDSILYTYCKNNNIEVIQVKLPRKNEESCTSGGCSITARIKYKIKTIPTAILLDTSGAVLAKTEYLDSVNEEGSQAYVTWVDNNLLF